LNSHAAFWPRLPAWQQGDARRLVPLRDPRRPVQPPAAHLAPRGGRPDGGGAPVYTIRTYTRCPLGRVVLEY